MEKKRIDFTTTEERLVWLKKKASQLEISVSQLLNKLIKNRILQETRYGSSTNKTDKEQYNIRKWCSGEIQYIPEGCTCDGIHIIKPDGSYMTHDEWVNS